MKKRLLDLFCGAGGCGAGYHLAGFDVTGIDCEDQRNYPFNFVQADAIATLSENIEDGSIRFFDAIHASPPCQGYSATKVLNANNHPLLIEETRRLLKLTGKPYIIENVPGAPLLNPVKLNGQMFGLMTDRERWFECSFEVPFFLLPSPRKAVKMGRPVNDRDVIQVVGHFSNVSYARKAMGIDWMTRDELAQAVPPAYTEYLGRILNKSHILL